MRRGESISLMVSLVFTGLSLAGVVVPSIGWPVAIGSTLLLGYFVFVHRDRPERAIRVALPRSRPRVRIDYSWREGDSKDNAFEFYNSGGAEALRIHVRPFGGYGLECQIEPISDLPPENAKRILRQPNVKGQAPMFATLPDMVDTFVRARAEETKRLGAAGEDRSYEKLKESLFATLGLTNSGKFQLLVTYESTDGRKYASEYELTFRWVGATQSIAIHWIRDE